MKEGWKYKPLGSIGEFKRGGNFKKSDFVDDGMPCVHYGQIHMTFGTSTNQHLSAIPQSIYDKCTKGEKGDLLIAITSEDVEGSCKCTAWTGDYAVALGGHMARFRHNLNPLYVSYFFQSPTFQRAKKEYTHGFKVVEIKPSDIAKITIGFPSPEEQAAIVSKLDTAFAKIEQVKEDARKALMEISDIRIAFTNEILLRNPASHPATLGSILKLRRGHDLTHAEMRGGIIPVAGSGGVIGFHDTALGPSPCVTIGRSGSVGKVFYYDFCWPHNTSLYIEDYKGNNPRYLYHLLRNLRAADYRGGAAVPTLNRNNLHPIQVSFCPDIEEQAHISSLLDSLDEKYDVIENNYNDILKECEQLKRSILKSIFE